MIVPMYTALYILWYSWTFRTLRGCISLAKRYYIEKWNVCRDLHEDVCPLSPLWVGFIVSVCRVLSGCAPEISRAYKDNW